MFYRENGQFKTSYSSDMQMLRIRQDRIFMFLLLAFAIVVVPLISSDYMLRAILVPFLILSIAAIGVNILVGYCGQITLGAGAFMAVGAYASWNLMTRIPDMPIVVCIVLGGFIAMAVGVVFGLPSLRVRGLYLAVATLAAQFFIEWAFLRIGWFTNYTPSGAISVGAIDFFGIPVVGDVGKYLFCLAFVIAVTVLAKNLVRGRTGRAWMAMRDMDIAAEIIGIRPLYAKLSAYAVSSLILGIAGALWGFVYLGSWEPAAFDINRSFQLLFVVIIGGLGSIMGSFFGAAFIVTLPIFLNQLLTFLGTLIGVTVSTATISHAEFMVFGALIVAFLVAEPHGLAKLWMIAREKLRLWPFPH